MTNKWSAQVQVKWNKNAPDWKDWNWKGEWKEVKWAASTMGEWDMILWVDVKTPEELEAFVHNKLWASNWVANTHSTWAKEVWNEWNKAA